MQAFPFTTTLFVLVCFSTVAGEQSLLESLKQNFRIGVVTDTYGTYTSNMKLTSMPNFENLLRANLLYDEQFLCDVEIELSGKNGGSTRIYFLPMDSDAAPNISFDFKFLESGDGKRYATGKYKTDGISFGVYSWRFMAENDFLLQFVDGIFSNVTTVHGYSSPTESPLSGWNHFLKAWGLVATVAGVFVIKAFLNVIQERRMKKRLMMAAATTKKSK